MTEQPVRSALPPVAPEVAATALDPLPPRLRKRVDGAVAKAAAWPVDATENGDGTVIRAVVRVDDETAVTLAAPHGAVTVADDVTCTCLLAPACLHRAAVLLRAPLAEEPPEPADAETAPPHPTPPSEPPPTPPSPEPPNAPCAPEPPHAPEPPTACPGPGPGPTNATLASEPPNVTDSPEPSHGNPPPGLPQATLDRQPPHDTLTPRPPHAPLDRELSHNTPTPELPHDILPPKPPHAPLDRKLSHTTPAPEPPHDTLTPEPPHSPPAPNHPPLTPPQTTSVLALWAAAVDVLVAGAGGAGGVVGAVHRARLLHAAHSARLAGLHRPAAAAVRVARRLGEASVEDPAFRLADLTQEVTEVLHVLHVLKTRRSADPVLTGTARRAYRPDQPLRLHGLFTEPVVTASGYAGVVTYALAPDGELRTLADVAPGGPDRVLRAARASVPGGCALSLRDLGDGGGATLTAPTVSPDGRIGAGSKVRSVRASGAAWTQTPLDDLWQRPPHTQLTRALTWLSTPVEERASAGGDLVFLRGTVTATGLFAVLGGPTLRLLAPDERPELPYAENVRLLAARPGLCLHVVARVSPDRPGGVLALAASWTGHDGRPFRADLGLRRLDSTHLPPHTEPATPLPAADPPALPTELGLLRRAVDRAVAGGRRVAAAHTAGDLTRRLRAAGLTTGARCAQRLTTAAADREHDALGRLRPADPDAYAEAWLAASLYTRAATASLLTAAWAPPSAPAHMES
ncbi:hypothetical protein AB0933_21045 [Streptomyces venezuelae]|uniref:hypothetical protein n=1 Tax=Streptomyces venezuelae TaxID=54571 RepID=UPI00345280FB